MDTIRARLAGHPEARQRERMNPIELWALIVVLVIVLNAIPAFMPPTWALLAYFHVHDGIDIWQLALVGALAAAMGRGVLAMSCRIWGIRVVPRRWRSNIDALGESIRQHRAMSLSMLGLFLLGPVPSNQLFIAIGISRVPLIPRLTVFATGRSLGYFFWIVAAGTAATSLSGVLRPGFGSAASIVVQVVGLVILVAVMQIDWSRIIRERRAKLPTQTSPASMSSN